MTDGICSVATPTLKLKLAGNAAPTAGAVATALAQKLSSRMTKTNYPALVDANGALPDCATTAIGASPVTCAPEKVTCACTGEEFFKTCSPVVSGSQCTEGESVNNPSYDSSCVSTFQQYICPFKDIVVAKVGEIYEVTGKTRAMSGMNGGGINSMMSDFVKGSSVLLAAPTLKVGGA